MALHAELRPRRKARHVFTDRGFFSRQRRGSQVIAGVVASVLVAAGLVFASTAQAAPYVPKVTLSSSGVAPEGILAGENETLKLSVTNPSATEPWFNMAVTAIVPDGITFVTAPVLGKPTVYQGPITLPNGLGTVAAGQSLWVWQDVSDLPAGASNDFEITVAAAQPVQTTGETADPTVFPVGSTFDVQMNAYASTAARYLPMFPGSTGKGGGAASAVTVNGNAPVTTTEVKAIRVTKSEPSPEGELLRGVHDNTTLYTISVQNSHFGPTTGVEIVDFIPAGLEFLGCGQTENTSSGAEYVGAAGLDATPAVLDCLAASHIETVENPDGQQPGVYTKVTWGPFDLAPKQELKVVYRAGIPMRANTMDWGSVDVADLGDLGQGSNLDNNNGASTRQSSDDPLATDGDVYTNTVTAHGTYGGVVRTASGRGASGTDDQSVYSMDLRVLKSVDSGADEAGEFVTGQVAKYTLNLKTSEYATASDISLTDVIPNGLCPILPSDVSIKSGEIAIPAVDGSSKTVQGVAAGDFPTDCTPGSTSGTGTWTNALVTGADVTWVAYNAATGEFIVNFSVAPITGANTEATVTYPVLMRGSYTGNELSTSSRDAFTNTVSMTATTTGLHGAEQGKTANVADDSSASVTAAGGTISKKILPRNAVASPASCPDDPSAYVQEATGNNLTFVLGDRVCYELTVNFATDSATRNPVISDMFPDGITYAGQSAKLFNGSTEITGVTWNSDVTDGVLTWKPSTDIAGNGDRLVPLASRLVIHVWGTVSSVSTSQNDLDKTANLMKYRQQNVEGAISFDRTSAESLVAAGLQLTKGVASVNGSTEFNQDASQPSKCSGTTPDCDNIQVVEGDKVTYRIDLPGAAADVAKLSVEDKLPAGITLGDVASVSEGGTAVDRGDDGVYVVWKNLSVAAAPAIRAPLTYVVTIPRGTSVEAVLPNTASITSYNFVTNPGGTVVTIVPGKDGIPIAGTSDDSNVFLPATTITKRVVSTDVGSTNNNGTGTATVSEPALPTPQAVHGEYITYEYSVTIPANTSVKNAVLKDAGLLKLKALGNAYIVDTSRTKLTSPVGGLPVGVGPDGTTPKTGSLNAQTGVLTFPALYDNTSNAPVTFTVQISAYTNGPDPEPDADPSAEPVEWAQNDILTNTASFTSTDAPKKTATATVQYVVPEPKIVKTVDDGGKPVTAGQTLTYSLTATNTTGRPTSFDTVVTDCVPSALTNVNLGVPSQGTTALGTCAGGTKITWAVGDIAAGETKTLSYTVVVSSSAAGGVSYTNTVALAGHALDNVAASDPRQLVLTSTAQKTVTVEDAKIVKTATPKGSNALGDKVDYTVTVTLPAKVNFFAPTIKDAVPTGLRVDGASIVVDPGTTGVTFACTPTTGGTDGGDIACVSSADILAAPLERTITLSYTATIVGATTPVRGDALKNTAAFAWIGVKNSADPADAKHVSDAESITVAEPNLTIKKYVNNVDAQNAGTAVNLAPGATANYRLDIKHPGGANTSAAYDVVITDVVPAGLVGVTPATSLPVGVTATTTVAGNGITTVVWKIAKIDPNTTVSLNYTATLAASATLTSAAIQNVAGITEYWSAANHVSNLDARRSSGGTDPANVKPAFPNVAVTKAAASGVTATVGTAFPWTITIVNSGSGAAKSVTASDVLPSGWGSPAVTKVTRNGVTIPAGQWGFAADSLAWTFADVAPGEIIIVTHTAVPTSAAYTAPGAGVGASATGPGNPHINTVAITATDASGADSNKTGGYVGGPATAKAFLRATDLTIVKTLVNDPDVKIWTGDKVSFLLTVTNNGPQSAGGVSISDTLPAGLTFAGVTTPGVSASGTWNPCVVTGETITCGLSANLAAGASASVKVTAIALASGVNDQLSKTLTNSASVSTTTPETDLTNNASSTPVTIWAKPSIDIVKKANVDTAAIEAGNDDTQYVLDGQTPARVAHFSITVTNTGPLALTNVTVADALAAACVNAKIPDLAAAGQDDDSYTYSCEGAAPGAAGYTNSATVTGETSNGTTATDTDTSRVELSAITVEKTGAVAGGLRPVVGDLVTYTFTVRNAGGSTLTDVALDDQLDGLSEITPAGWSTLAPGATVKATATYALTQADIDSQVDNTVTVQGIDPAGQTPTDSDDLTVNPAEAPSIDLLKTGSESSLPSGRAGDLVTYTFVATNTGNTTLIDVTIADPLPGLEALDFDWSDAQAEGILAPGETVSATADYRLTQSDIDAGIVENTATASGTNPSGTTPVTDDSSWDVVITPQPLITLVKTGALAAGATGKAGDTVEYTLTATNTGSVTLTGVTIADPLTGLGALTYAWPGATGTLAPAEHVTATASYVLTQADVDAGKVYNAATATGTSPGGPTTGVEVDGDDHKTVNVPAQPAISLEKKGVLATGDTGLLGDTVNYTFTAKNTGNVTLTGVGIDDVSLPGLTALVYGTWPGAVGTLAPGQSITATASYVLLQSDVELGYVDNHATTQGTPPADLAGNPRPAVTDDDDERVATLQAPAITLVKDAAFASGQLGAVGDTVDYAFTATNTGNVTLTGVTIADPMKGLSPLTYAWPGATGVLLPGAVVTATASYLVKQADVDAGTVANTATATGKPPKSAPVSDSDDAVVSPPQASAIDLVKDAALAAGATGIAGDTVNYTFTVTNTGTVTLRGVTIADPMAGLSAVKFGTWPGARGVLLPGASVTASANYVLTQADVDAGVVNNVATTTGTPQVGAPVTDDDPASVDTLRDPAISLTKTGEFTGGAGGVVGGSAEYAFTVTNTGTVTLTGIAISDELPGLSAVTYGAWPVAAGTLAPGESVTATAHLVLTQAHLDAGSLVNTATVAGTPPTGDPVTDTDDVTLTVTPTPAISLTKSGSLLASATGKVGDGVQFVMVATNVGNVTLHGVSVSDRMPGLSALAYGAWPAEAGVLAPGESVTVTATYLLTAADVRAQTVKNTATVVGTAGPNGEPGVSVNDTSTATVTLLGSGLSSTGADPGPALGLAALILGLGALLLAAARRKRRREGQSA